MSKSFDNVLRTAYMAGLEKGMHLATLDISEGRKSSPGYHEHLYQRWRMNFADPQPEEDVPASIDEEPLAEWELVFLQTGKVLTCKRSPHEHTQACFEKRA